MIRTDYYPSFLFIVMITTKTKGNLGSRRVYISLPSITKGQGRNLEAESEAGAMKDHCFLVCSLAL